MSSMESIYGEDHGVIPQSACWNGPGSPCRYCGSIEHNPDMPQIACVELLRAEIRQHYEGMLEYRTLAYVSAPLGKLVKLDEKYLYQEKPRSLTEDQ